MSFGYTLLDNMTQTISATPVPQSLSALLKVVKKRTFVWASSMRGIEQALTLCISLKLHTSEGETRQQ